MAVFCEGNNTLTTQYNIYWDLEYFWRATHFVAVFCEGNKTLTTQCNIFWDPLRCLLCKLSEASCFKTILPCNDYKRKKYTKKLKWKPCQRLRLHSELCLRMPMTCRDCDGPPLGSASRCLWCPEPASQLPSGLASLSSRLAVSH